MATLPAALSLFMRADIEANTAPIVAETSRANALESVRTKGSWVDASAYGIPREDAFMRRVSMKLVDREAPPNQPPGGSTFKTAPNGQLKWDTSAHRMLVSTPRSVGVVGSLRSGEKIDLGNVVEITPGATQQKWATINATVMDGDDFRTARRILLTATGTAENTGMQWKDPEHTSVGSDWGRAPSLVEGINAKITLPAIQGAKAWTLDGTGQRKAELPITWNNGHMQIDLSNTQKTLWWEIAVP
jgi:hypothetical protein